MAYSYSDYTVFDFYFEPGIYQFKLNASSF
jgi:hypothetical protein